MRYDYCPRCGGHLGLGKFQDENKPQCENCGFVFFQNPIVGVAAIVLRNQKILLGRRVGSYEGKWCIPCGYVEWDEDVYDAVKREFQEETGIQIEVERVFKVLSNFHNPQQHTVGIWFLANEIGGEAQAGDDLDGLGFFNYDNIPSLAFPTDQVVLDKLKKDGLMV